ncbi:zinc finger protein 347-like [Anoplophora glabripennis]|uniref:zinc finger protein 347-like n=1 Tax=Anoplophora glabripennis TaxID=217634 RepID=UPI000875770B|nr:zinc finger protein 347-like [Anoplophora glabripennis]
MSGVQGTLCKLCLKTITDKRFEIIDNAIRDILHVLLLKLEFDSDSKKVICNVCRTKLNTALEFKTMCLNTDSTVIPYVDSKTVLQLDLRDVYMQEKKSELVCSQKICRLCMQPVESEFKCIREEELEAIEKLAPEMIINIVKDPIVCKPCFNSLCTHNGFLKDCLEGEEKIKSSFDSAATESQIDTTPRDLFAKTENLVKEFDINEMEMSIKTECVDIKSEDEERRDLPLQTSNIEPFEESDCKDAKCQVKHKAEFYKCKFCDFETKQRTIFNSHCIKHIDTDKCEEVDYKTMYKAVMHEDATQLPIYKFKVFDYKSKKNILLICRQLTHKDPSQVKMYRCNDCDYETKYKCAFKLHRLKHKDPLQVHMYKCNDCNFETMYKQNVTQHQLIHKDHLQVKMYKCNDCDFETKYKQSITQHQLIHKDHLQVKMYKCNDCDFETKYKQSITQHQLIHKDHLQVKMYKCNDCDFETKHKYNMKGHQLKHKDTSQVQMYKCNNCNFESKYKKATIRHQLKHKDLLQVQKYRCNDCNYGTKYKSNIESHQLTHKDPSQAKIYRCNDCVYETINRSYIRKHQLKHRDPSQIKMYRCNECDYKSIYKLCLTQHQLKHKDPSQIKMYRCNECDYESKYKNNISRHMLKHRKRS